MADAIVVKYQGDVKDLVNALNKVEKENLTIEKTSKKASKSMEDNYSKASSSIVSGLKNIAVAAGVAFGTQQLVAFGKEAVQVAAKAEGVERAFNKLNRANLLDELRRATRGTVSDLDLMQQAVRANNFQVPLEKLASFFEFATKRSIETGESVDYLVQSIVDGIGRKSTLVLDNLGISAAQLQEEIKRTGDFGEAAANIIEQSLAQTGEVADTTAVKIAQLNTLLENTKKTAGDFIIEFAFESAKMFGVISQNQKAVDELSSSLENMSVLAISEQIKSQRQELEKAKKAYEDFRIVMDDMAERSPDLAVKEEARLGAEIKLQKELYKLTVDTFNARIESARSSDTDFIDPSQLDAITASVEKQDEATSDYVRSISQLNTELKVYNEELKNAEVGSTQFFNIVDKITSKTKELNEAIAQTNLADVLKVDIEDDFDIASIQSYLDEINSIFQDNVEIRTDGSEKIQQQIDAELQSTLSALDEEQIARERLDEQRQENHEKQKKRLEEERRYSLQILSEAGQLVNTIGQLQQQSLRYDMELLKERYNQGKISREKFENEEREIRRKSAAASKAYAIFQAVVNTAVGITQALSSTPPPYSYVLAGISGALGAAQIAVAASEPVPKFAEGGWVDQRGYIHGRKHGQGGVMIEAEGDEYITKGIQAKKYASIIEAVNGDYWEKYKQEQIIAPAIDHILNSKGFESMGSSYLINGGLNAKDYFKGIDRNRKAQRDGFMYLGKKIDGLKQKNSRYA